MFVVHLALGGCLGVPPIRYGLTSDTGGHIAYVIGAALAQADLRRVRKVSLVTRLFEDEDLGWEFARPLERLAEKVEIVRLLSGNRSYLEKAALGADLPAFTTAFRKHLSTLRTLPDVIHAHFADAASVASAARAQFGIPFVYTPHALGLDKRDKMAGNPALDQRIEMERDAIANADALIVSSRNEALHQVAAYGVAGASARTFCIPPGVPVRPTVPGQVAAGTSAIDNLDDPSKPIVLAIARPVRKKNLLAIVQAYMASAPLRQRANLVILAGQHGRGTASVEEQQVISEIRALCEHPALRGLVAFPPEHNDADVGALYAKAAAGGVFVNSALHEPFGLTLIEAAQAGVPVVATRYGGSADIVAAIGHGILADPLNERDIGSSCLRIVSHSTLHETLSRAARANVGKYDWQRFSGESVSVYASLRRNPKLLASDIDNTLTGCRLGARLFTQWQESAEMPFVLATGRSLGCARAVLAEWDLPEPDAFIVDVGSRIALRTADGDWTHCADYTANLDAGWNRQAVASLLANFGVDPQPSETHGPHKLSFYGSQTQADGIRQALDDAGLGAKVVFSHGRLIDVLAPRAGKAEALAWVAAWYGLSLGDCIAAGDSGNDLDMLATCGFAIAVTNGGRELDALEPRAGLVRVSGCHANGVMEGLAAFGLAAPVPDNVAA